MCNGIRAKVTILEKNLESSPLMKNQYLNLLRVVQDREIEKGQEDEDHLTEEDLYEWLLDGCTPELVCLLPSANYPPVPTLEHCINAPTRFYTLYATEDDEFTLLEATRVQGDRPFLGVYLPEELCSPFSCFEPSQVQICAESPEEGLSQLPRRVQTDGGLTHFFRPYLSGDDGRARRELQKYDEISAAGFGDLRISQLTGLVRDVSGSVLGLLLTLIEPEDPELSCATLSCAIRSDTPAYLRQRWAEQITYIVDRLHGAGITWGDAKPENILIDAEDNAWIIDFGGSYTEGWVEKDIAGTLQGDEQGLSRIIQYIDD